MYTDEMKLAHPVVTADGETIGTVGAIGEDAFQVSAPRRPDFWLGAEHVAEERDDTYVLNLREAEVGEAALSAPHTYQTFRKRHRIDLGRITHLFGGAEHERHLA